MAKNDYDSLMEADRLMCNSHDHACLFESMARMNGTGKKRDLTDQ